MSWYAGLAEIRRRKFTTKGWPYYYKPAWRQTVLLHRFTNQYPKKSERQMLILKD
jgi:hypothetical protein